MKFMNQRWKYSYQDEAGGEGDKGGGGTPTFLESLPEDLRSNGALANFKDAGSLAKSFVEMKSMQGSSIRIPSTEASDEDRNAFNQKLIEQVPNVMLRPNFDDAVQSSEFYRTLGMPEEANGYEMPKVEGIEMPEERGAALSKIAHEAGLTKSQFGKVMEAALQLDVQAAEAQAANLKVEAEALHTEWGMAFDERKGMVLAVAKHTGAPDRLIAAIDADEAGVETMQWILKMSAFVKGEGINIANQNGDDADGDNGKMTPSEARGQISDIQGNKSHPYWNQNDPAHNDALKKMVELQAAAKAS